LTAYEDVVEFRRNISQVAGQQKWVPYASCENESEASVVAEMGGPITRLVGRKKGVKHEKVCCYAVSGLSAFALRLCSTILLN
jgi:hypothetical protein